MFAWAIAGLAQKGGGVFSALWGGEAWWARGVVVFVAAERTSLAIWLCIWAQEGGGGSWECNAQRDGVEGMWSGVS